MDCDDRQCATMTARSMAGHFAAVRRDLSHARELLREAVSGLLADALALRQSAARLHALGEINPSDAESQELGRNIRERADATVIGLQFEDMAAQLLDHVQGHVDRLEALVDAGRAADEPEWPMGMEAAIRPPVACRDLRSGDVELF